MFEPKKWGEIVELRYGKALSGYRDDPDATVPVYGTNGPVGFTRIPQVNRSGVIVGRKGAYRGVHYSAAPFSVIDTAFYVESGPKVYDRWAFYALQLADINGLDSGSAIPSTTREAFYSLPLLLPPLPTQKAIVDVLGALDDKIATNAKLAGTASILAGLIFDQATVGIESQPMSQVLKPVLGGTPPRSSSDFWDGEQLWASARDITGAKFGVVTDTEEKITDLAVANTKAKPLPKGSVVLTARGTVGAVARLAVPASFNQSCYGFVPGVVPPGVLFLAIERATERAKEIAHGSVFDTITMKTFDHLAFPRFDSGSISETESKIDPLLESVSAAVTENASLAATRDALLPQLMSGKLRVKDAERVLEDAGV